MRGRKPQPDGEPDLVCNQGEGHGAVAIPDYVESGKAKKAWQHATITGTRGIYWDEGDPKEEQEEEETGPAAEVKSSSPGAAQPPAVVRAEDLQDRPVDGPADRLAGAGQGARRRRQDRALGVRELLRDRIRGQLRGGLGMTEPITLADRMKRYEHVERRYLPRRTYTLLRLDGRAFHTYTRGMERPFDGRLALAMNETASALCREISGARFAYVQSDEISLLLTDFASHGTEPWMGGDLAKVLSLSAAIATAAFNGAVPSNWRDRGPALFDSRAWTIADPNEVANYFVWRQRDCVKNSITMVAQAHFPHGRLDGLNSAQRQELLFQEAGVNWNDTPDGFKRGRVTVKETYHVGGTEGQVPVPRTRWVGQAAPHFAVEPGSWLAGQIPRMPALPEHDIVQP